MKSLSTALDSRPGADKISAHSKSNMKTISMLTAAVMAVSISGVLAQPAPGEKKWDISKVDTSKFPPAATDQGVTFDKDIEPIFKKSCAKCHSGDRPRANFKVDSLENVLKGGRDGDMVSAGDSKNSLLVAAVSQVSPRLAMPPKPRNRGGGPGGGPPPGGGPGGDAGGGPGGGPPPGGPGGPPPAPLTTSEVSLVRAWIDQGAK